MSRRMSQDDFAPWRTKDAVEAKLQGWRIVRSRKRAVKLDRRGSAIFANRVLESRKVWLWRPLVQAGFTSMETVTARFDENMSFKMIHKIDIAHGGKIPYNEAMGLFRAEVEGSLKELINVEM
jgi:hypothetical protein